MAANAEAIAEQPITSANDRDMLGTMVVTVAVVVCWEVEKRVPPSVGPMMKAKVAAASLVSEVEKVKK